MNDAKNIAKEPVLYCQLPYTQHAFDLFYSPHCLETIKAIHTFSEIIYHAYVKAEFTD